jgi:hypothetical protein
MTDFDSSRLFQTTLALFVAVAREVTHRTSLPAIEDGREPPPLTHWVVAHPALPVTAPSRSRR